MARMSRPAFLSWMLVAALSLASGVSAATRYQLADPIFHVVAGGEEIPEDVVSAIEQDLSGFLWIGTPDGLVRYDGYTFRVFRHDPRDPHSLGENHVRAICGTHDGRVWIGTSDGVSIFDPRSEHFQTLSAQLTNGNIRALAEGAGVMWIATTEGLDVVDERTLRVSHVATAPPGTQAKERSKLAALLLDERGDLWIGSADGLTVRRKNGAVEAAAFDGKPVQRIFRARDGAMWIGIFNGGIARFDPRSGAISMLDPQQRAYAFAQPEAGTVWAGTTSDGIEVRDATTGRLIRHLQHDASNPESIVSNRIGSLFVDASGIVWIGTTGRGLCKHNPADGAFSMLRFSPTNNERLTSGEIESVFESSDGLLWVGTHDNGVDLFDSSARIGGYRVVSAAKSGLASPNIGAIAETDDGSMWFGGVGTLDRLERKSGRIETFATIPFGKTADRLTSILPAPHQNGLWVGTNNGLLFFDRTSKSWRVPDLDNGKPLNGTITDLELGADDALWVATLTGLAVLPRGESRFHLLTNKHGTSGTLPTGTPLSFLRDTKDRLWIGMSNGLVRLDSFKGRDARFVSIAPLLGLDNRRCDNLLEDAMGRIWIEDNAVFDPATLRIRRFGADQGAGRSIWRGAAIRTRSGQFVLGGPDGLFFIDPAALVEWDYAPPVVLTSVVIDGVSRAPASIDTLSIESGSKSLAFEFSALDYSAPRLNRYQYRLRGFDHDWIEVDALHRSASYTSLPPGDYVFELRGSNREGKWSTGNVAIAMDVKPVFYQTTIFRVLAALVLMGLTWPLYRIRLRILETRQKELEKIVAQRTAEVKESEKRALEASQAKSIFLANMSHELRTPLNATLGYARLMRRSPNLGPADLDNLAVVERSGEHLLSLINQVLSISKIEAGKMTIDAADFDLRETIVTIERMFRTRAEQGALQFETVVADNVPAHVHGDEAKLRQALINLLGNAVKFTPRGGNVRFDVSALHGRVCFMISDTGAGIAPDELRTLFEPFTQTESGRQAKEGSGLGLAITKRIVELMGGTIEAESTQGEGSTFRFEVPLAVAAARVERKEAPRVVALARGQKAPKILVADDTPENRELLARLLTIIGCEVRIVADGAAAVDAWHEWHPQLIFMDMRMPVMDGRAASREIRLHEHQDQRTVIALTASVYAEERDSLLKAGIDDVIFKPYMEEEIFAKLEQHLGLRFVHEGEIVVDRTRRVLLTDDDYVNRAVAGEMLRIARYDVIEAKNGEEALERLQREGPFDAVVLDVEMPRMGGIETVRRIRGDERFRDLPVIALTAHSDADDVRTLKAAGMDATVSKPVEAADLTGKLADLLQVRAAGVLGHQGAGPS